MGARTDWDGAIAKVRELREAIKPWPPGDPDEVQCQGIEQAHDQAESLVDQLSTHNSPSAAP